MRPEYLWLLAFVMLMSSCAAERPFNTARQINEECILEMETARTAIRLRERGKQKHELAQNLPPLDSHSNRLLYNIHVILDEVYQYDKLNEVIYSTYRFELCSRQLNNKTYPYNISIIYPALLTCQQEFAAEATPEATQCIVASFAVNRN